MGAEFFIDWTKDKIVKKKKQQLKLNPKVLTFFFETQTTNL